MQTYAQRKCRKISLNLQTVLLLIYDTYDDSKAPNPKIPLCKPMPSEGIENLLAIGYLGALILLYDMIMPSLKRVQKGNHKGKYKRYQKGKETIKEP